MGVARGQEEGRMRIICLMGRVPVLQDKDFQIWIAAIGTNIMNIYELLNMVKMINFMLPVFYHHKNFGGNKNLGSLI